MDKINIFNEDCIKNIEKIKKAGVIFDAIITDPPYNISKKITFLA